jgi:hypothetical protein
MLRRKPNLKRYYVHGDIAEQDSAEVYCAKCDTFEPVSHFYEPMAHSWSSHTDYERYERMRKGFARRDCPLHEHYFRPLNATNIFAQVWHGNRAEASSTRIAV